MHSGKPRAGQFSSSDPLDRAHLDSLLDQGVAAWLTPADLTADPGLLAARSAQLAVEVEGAEDEGRLAVERRYETVAAAGVWQDGVHPLDGTRERHVQTIVYAADDPTAALSLLYRLAADAEADGCDWLRVTASTRSQLPGLISAGGFASVHYYISRKVLSDHPQQLATARLTSDEEEAEFARFCLAAAVRNGLDADIETELDVDMFVAESLQWDQKDRLSYVLRDGGHLVAHALLDIRDDRTTAALFDLFVPDQHRGKGYARTLGRLVEADLSARDVRFLEGTVVTGHRPPSPGLVANLEADGWWLDRVIMRRRLATAT